MIHSHIPRIHILHLGSLPLETEDAMSYGMCTAAGNVNCPQPENPRAISANPSAYGRESASVRMIPSTSILRTMLLV